METLSVPDWIARRDLLYSPKGSSKRLPFSVCVYAPYELTEGSVDFPLWPGAAGCLVQTFGLPQEVIKTAYGADTVQALEIACSMDILRRFHREIDFYFPDGGPYFED